MLYRDYSVETVSDCLGIDVSTVYRYWNIYKSKGLDSFLENRYKGYCGLLSSAELSLLRHELKRTLYTDARSVSKWIKDTFGVDYTPQGTADLLNRNKKTKEVPCECNEEKQLAFMEKLPEVMRDPDEETVVYYAGGVHPTHNSRSTYAGIEKGEDFEQPTVSGRDRVNINGLVNAKDVTDVIYVDCESVNAKPAKELYQKALEKHLKARKIYITPGNARYFLPPYSPNLNLIERLWKFLRKKVINTHFYRTKELFRKAIHDFFDEIGRYMSELETLLTLNFRVVNSQSFSF